MPMEPKLHVQAPQKNGSFFDEVLLLREGKMGSFNNSARNTEISIWDTQYVPSFEAFTMYRDAVCKVYMPWSPEYKSDREFQARLAGVNLGPGAIGRCQLPSLTIVRSKEDIAHSPIDCVYASFVLSGEVNVDQGGRFSFATPGDLVIYDSSLPTILKTRQSQEYEEESQKYEDLTLVIPKDRLAMISQAGLSANVITRDQMVRPLSSCLSFLAHKMLDSSKDELASLFDACTSLLPVAAGCLKGRSEDIVDVQSNYLLREILDFMNLNIADPNLSPHQAASHVGISARYVHKLFADQGTTFSSYVMAKRLDRVRKDLTLAEPKRLPVFLVAYRWGFTDLSTFFRAFKKKFGCAPGRFRMEH
jgi:AraC family transcriptional regulator, positive regulator of tynA and feaB